MQMEVTLVGARFPGGKRDVRFFVPPSSSPDETFSQLLGRIRELVRRDPILQRVASEEELQKYCLVVGKSGGYYPLNEKWRDFQPSRSRWKLQVTKEIEREEEREETSEEIVYQAKEAQAPKTRPSSVPRFLNATEGVEVERKVGIPLNEAKNELQKLYQSCLGPRAIPSYRELPVKSTTGHFFLSVDLQELVGGEKMVGYGRAPTKREAEKLAALDACQKYLERVPQEKLEEEENPTVTLNETFHQIFGQSPSFVYSEARTGGYCAQLEVNGTILEATASNKSKAARLVSQKALVLLRKPQGQSFTTLRIGS